MDLRSVPVLRTRGELCAAVTLPARNYFHSAALFEMDFRLQTGQLLTHEIALLLAHGNSMSVRHSPVSLN
jgi:hypothetical protein